MITAPTTAPVAIRLVPATTADAVESVRLLTEAERRECVTLGSTEIRIAARIAAKCAAAELLAPELAGDQAPDEVAERLVIIHDSRGAPSVLTPADLGSLRVAVSISHSGGWGAALAWLP